MRASVRKLQDVFDELRLLTELSEIVLNYRRCHDARLLDALPDLCPGLEVSRHRNRDDEITYTGVVLLEVNDLQSQDDVRAAKDAALLLPTTLAAVQGASGRTVKILVRGQRPDGTLPTDDEEIRAFHRTLYNTACRVYNAVLPKAVASNDAQPEDAFTMPYDPDAVFQSDAAPFTVRPEHIRALDGDSVDHAQAFAPNSTTPESYDYWQRRFNDVVLAVQEQQYGTATPVDTMSRLSLVAHRAAEAAIPVEEAVERACRHYLWSGEERGSVRAVVEGVYAEAAAAARRQKRGSTMQDLTYRLGEWMRSRYDLRYNELTNGVEWRQNSSYGHRFRPLDSRVVNTMIQEANESGLEIFDRDMRRYLGSSRIRDFNEAHAYLRSVSGCWDGETDHIGDLARRVPTANERWVEWFHTWFLAMVAQWRGMDTRHGNSTVPLLA